MIAKSFVICFDSGIIVITHWNVHNKIRKDRKKETFFQKERQLLTVGENGMYTASIQYDNQMSAICQPIDNQMTAQDKLSKVKLREDKDIVSTAVDAQPRFDYQSVIDLFNSLCVSLPKVQKLTDKRRKAIKNAHKLLGKTSFDELFAKVEKSDFLTGRTGK